MIEFYPRDMAKILNWLWRQYSGNEHQVIRGMGLVSCVYVNPDTHCFWVIDYRIYDPDGDGSSKIDHVLEMLQGVVYQYGVGFENSLNRHMVCQPKSHRSYWKARQNILLSLKEEPISWWNPTPVKIINLLNL
jgi:hypothetical protein